MPADLPPDAPCPCGARIPAPEGRRPSQARPYVACCGRWHSGPEWGQADTAEALMRSRYSAYVLGRMDYLLATWHPNTRPAELAPDPAGLRWLGLSVREHRQTGPDRASVHFVARHKRGGRAERLEEHSRFVRESDGRWYYLDGEFPSAPADEKA